MNYAKDIDKLTATASTWKFCEHKNGVWFTIKFLWFKRKYFWCYDCEKCIEEKIMKFQKKLLKK